MTDDVQPPCDTEPYDWRVDWAQVLFDLRMQDQKAESDESLDCRNGIPRESGLVRLARPPAPFRDGTTVGAQPAARHDPRSLGIARALRRLCDGAEWRMGCADYEPER